MRRLARRLRREEGGYSMLELVMVMAILSAVLGGLTALFLSASTSELSLNNRFQAQLNAALALSKLRTDVHCASSITPTGGASSITLTQPGPCSSRTVTDGVLNSTTTVTSANAAFTSGDVGRSITGTGIPAGASVSAVASATSVTISAAATATATGVSLTIAGTPRSVMWCTVAEPAPNGSKYDLYRTVGATCDATGIKEAESLTLSFGTTAGCLVNGASATNLFYFTAQSAGSSLAKLHVDLPVNTSSKTLNQYELCDDLILRNSSRA
jgi:type II secretory pathway pseudopilin PulG